MSNNTRARHEQLYSLAAEIAARERINPHDYDRDNRPCIAEIMKRGECHKETARGIWAKWLRRNRHPDMRQNWGGQRENAGRKTKLPE